MSDKQIDIIHDGIDVLLHAGQFEFVDWIMQNMVPDRWGTDDVLSILTATLPAKSKLEKREWFLRRAKARLPRDVPLEGLE